MITFLTLILAIVFIFLAIIHINWALGGRWGFEKSLPKKANGEMVMVPTNFDCAIVAIGLLICGFFYLLNSGLFLFQMPGWLSILGFWVIPILFVGRAIGEFRYVGFFKKIKTTDFGMIDSKLFSPLCLCIGLIGFSILLLNQ